MGVIDPEEETAILHGVKIIGGEVEEFVKYLMAADYTKAILTLADAHDGCYEIVQKLMPFVAQADIDELSAIKWDTETRIKWRAENKEFYDTRVKKAAEAKDQAIKEFAKKIVGGLFGE